MYLSVNVLHNKVICIRLINYIDIDLYIGLRQKLTRATITLTCHKSTPFTVFLSTYRFTAMYIRKAVCASKGIT